MSSGFVSGGTTDKPTERDDEWLKAQQEIEANRRRKEEESRQQGGKSLYEVLQNNKAAKEEAFQESIKLKNQFRNLDEDEVEFLDAVLESTRAKEQAVKKETSEQLDLFRRQQEEAEKALLDEGIKASDAAASPTGPSSDTQWALNAKKRKRAKEDKGLKGLKIRRSSSTIEGPSSLADKNSTNDQTPSQTDTKVSIKGDTKEIPKSEHTALPLSKRVDEKSTAVPKGSSPKKPSALSGLGLADYSSEED
ncbi:MAG: hypothetical protein Q9195_009409 [Heterodermia aff. obscurata]